MPYGIGWVLLKFKKCVFYCFGVNNYGDGRIHIGMVSKYKASQTSFIKSISSTHYYTVYISYEVNLI